MILRRTLLLFALLTSTLAAQVTVVNAASNRAELPLAPGTWASAYGVFTNVVTLVAPSTPFPKTLNGVKVAIDGIDSPVHFVSATQINFLIPYAVAPGLKSVLVTTPTTTYNGTVRIMTSSPGIFTKDQATPPKGAILNQATGENTTSNRALRGEVIQIFGTGPSALNATLVDGAPVQASPLVQTLSTPQVFIGGVEATLQFSGMAPGLVGVWQVNAFIPQNSFITGRVPVQIFIDGVDSNEVTVFVQ